MPPQRAKLHDPLTIAEHARLLAALSIESYPNDKEKIEPGDYLSQSENDAYARTYLSWELTGVRKEVSVQKVGGIDGAYERCGVTDYWITLPKWLIGSVRVQKVGSVERDAMIGITFHGRIMRVGQESK